MKKLIADILIGWAFRLDPERFVKEKPKAIIFTKGEEYTPKSEVEQEFLKQHPMCAPSGEVDEEAIEDYTTDFSVASSLLRHAEDEIREGIHL